MPLSAAGWSAFPIFPLLYMGGEGGALQLHPSRKTSPRAKQKDIRGLNKDCTMFSASVWVKMLPYALGPSERVLSSDHRPQTLVLVAFVWKWSMLHLLKQISVNDNFILVGVPVASVYLGFISLIALLYRLNCKILIEPQPTFAAVGCKSCITKVT